MEISDELVDGKNVLLIWNENCYPGEMKQVVESLRSKTGVTGNISLEHAERLIMAEHLSSSFDLVISGAIPPALLYHTSELLEEFARVLKPSGLLRLAEPVSTGDEHIPNIRSIKKLPSALKFSGFVKVSECSVLCSGNVLAADVRLKLEEIVGCLIHENKGVAIAEISASKPSYEVGTSTRLPGVRKLAAANSVSNYTAKIWSLSADDMFDDDIELLDSDTLLAQEDLEKPDPASLRSECGTSSQGKRKACKNCSCGLAELEADDKKSQAKPATSSCGNCYLGDAFRCSSCPYLGMPAFKHGEKIGLSERQLKADQ